MVRTFGALLAGALLLAPGALAAPEGPPAGTWKVSVVGQEGISLLWLLKIEQKDGKWAGTLLDTQQGIGESSLDNLRVEGDLLRFNVRVRTRRGVSYWSFEGKLPKDGAKLIRGSLGDDKELSPSELEASDLKTLDAVEISKELLAKQPSDPRVFDAALSLLNQAAKIQAKPEEVRGWAEKAWKAAEPFGVRWQRHVAVMMAGVLADQEGFAPVAVGYAQRAERLLEPKDDPAVHLRVLTVLSAALKKAGKADQAKELEPRLARFEKEDKARQEKLAKERDAAQAKDDAKADEEYLKTMPPFKVAPFAGRKAKSDRAVLAELFTGAQCPPCVAADLAFDGLAKTYKPTEVVLLQYHLHANGPDPMVCPASMARAEFYGDQYDGCPSILFNGKAEEAGPGDVRGSEAVYNAWRKSIDALLEKPATVKLKAAAQKKGGVISITAEASDLVAPGEDIRLRVALTVERIRYAGGNGIRFHHHVVRAMPGGEKGQALKDKSGKLTAQVNLDDLRKQLEISLAEFSAKTRIRLPNLGAVLELKDLRVVAFVQDDKTKEVLQAVQVDVQEAKE